MRKAIAYSVILVLICIFSCSFSESATAKLQELYAEAELKMVEGDYTGAADIFDRLGTYSDCSQMAMYCKAIAAAETLGLYDVAIDAFKKLGEFRDCQQLTVYYGGRSLEATADAVLNEISSFTDDDLEDTKTVLSLAKGKYAELALFKDCLSRISACDNKTKVLEQELQDRQRAAKQEKYDQAKSYEDAGEYLKAIKIYQTIIDFEDSAKRIDVCTFAYKADNYYEGMKKKEAKDWDGAVAAFINADDFSDAKEQISATRYEEGLDKKSLQDYVGAVAAFEKAPDYLDAKDLVKECWYLEGIKRRDRQEWDEAFQAFQNAGDYGDASLQINETKYQKAAALELAGDQEGAYKLFIGLGDYRDAYDRAYKPYYDLGLAKREAKEWTDAVAAFEFVGEYSDAQVQILETYYLEGKYCSAEKSYDKAICAFEKVMDYKDTRLLLEEKGICDVWARYQAVDKAFSDYGNLVKLGRFEGESIEWIVIKTEGDHSLLVSKKGLDSMPYSYHKSDECYWYNSSVRSWLADFYNTAFTDDERSAILLTDNDNGRETNHIEDWDEGFKKRPIEGNTSDYVFLLGNNEVGLLADLKEGLRCKPWGQDSIDCICWWTRTPRYWGTDIWFVKADGGINVHAADNSYWVRPAMWIDRKTIRAVYTEKIVDQYEGLNSLEIAKVKSEEAFTSIGEHVLFGSYEQDNVPGNGKEKIQWLILDVQDHKALLISQYCLDYKEYFPRQAAVNWGKSSLRKWLNSDFIGSAFSPEEQEIIALTTIDNSTNINRYDAYPGRDGKTQDKVFILNTEEIDHYLKDPSCDLTRYVSELVKQHDKYGGDIYWARSNSAQCRDKSLKESYNKFFTAVVSDRYPYDSPAGRRTDSLQPVRAALWVDLDQLGKYIENHPDESLYWLQ